MKSELTLLKEELESYTESRGRNADLPAATLREMIRRALCKTKCEPKVETFETSTDQMIAIRNFNSDNMFLSWYYNEKGEIVTAVTFLDENGRRKSYRELNTNITKETIK